MVILPNPPAPVRFEAQQARPDARSPCSNERCGMIMKLTPALAALMLAACDQGGLTSADVQNAAKERVREALGLAPEAVLFTQTFVGEPVDGDTVVCGTVEGKTADGRVVTPRRFIAAADPARWVKFEPVTNSTLPSQPQKFVEWYGTCEPRSEAFTDAS